MKPSRVIRLLLAAFATVAGSLPASVSACAACFGQSDAPMAKGMNAGIFALLTVITSVLLGIAIFFAYILRRAARLASTTSDRSAAPALSVTQSLSQPTH